MYESAHLYLGLPFCVCINTNTQAAWFTTTRCWRNAVLRPSVTLYIVFSFSWKGVNGYKNYILSVCSLFSLCNFIAVFFFFLMALFCCSFVCMKFCSWFGAFCKCMYFLKAGKAKEKDHKLKLAEWVFNLRKINPFVLHRKQHLYRKQHLV